MAMLTHLAMQKKVTGKDLWITEDGPVGEGRLCARLTAAGKKTLYFRYTAPDGQRVRMRLGTYDENGVHGLSLTQARREVADLRKKYKDAGKDLRGHKQAQQAVEQERLALEAARLRAEAEALEAERKAREAAEAARITVTQLFERWHSTTLVHRKDRGAEMRRLFEKDVLPVVGHVAVEDLKKGHVTEVVDKLKSRGVDRTARVAFASIRQMLRFAVDRDVLEVDPTASMRKSKIVGADVERERKLEADEIRMLVRQMPAARLADSTERAVWIALATCCRIGELLTARWENVDLERRTWLIPASNAKNGKALKVALSDFAVEQFRKLRDAAEADLQERRQADPQAMLTPWVYPNRTLDDHVCPKTVTKQLADRQRQGAKPMSGRAKGDRATALVLPGGKWGPHDLRRTGASTMGELGVMPDVIERCLNHKQQDKVKRIYQRHNYEAEMRQAWQLLGDRLALLVSTAEGGNIHVLPTRAA